MGSRIDALRSRMADRGISAFVSMSMPTIQYMTGFTGSTGGYIATETEARLLVDSRYTEQAQAETSDCTLQDFSAHLGKSLGETLADMGVPSCACEESLLTVTAHRSLAKAFGGELTNAGDLVEGLRMIKSADEIEKIRRAIQLAESILTDLHDRIVDGMPEREAGAWLTYEAQRRGATGPSFPPIALWADRSSLPHGQPGDASLKHGDVMLFDYGCHLDGYCSDLTRTYAYGTISGSWFEEIYGITLEAQLAAIDALKPGITGRKADDAARSIIDAAGYGDHFGHSTGHGVGIEVHEGPRLSKLADECLEPGMVVTVEPGIYLPGKGGVRIEDMAVITESGCEVLTSLPKDLKVIG